MKNKKWRSLLHKVEYLRLDLEDKEEVAKEIETQFVSRMSQLDSENNSQSDGAESGIDHQQMVARVDVIDRSKDPEMNQGSSNETHEPDPGSRGDGEDRPENMRKIWRSIATVAHPDKTGGDLRLTELYKKAARAWDDGKYEELISVAIELGLSTDGADENAVALLEARADKINKRISAIEASILWQWHKAPTDKKDAIIKLYLEHKRRTNGGAKCR